MRGVGVTVREQICIAWEFYFPRDRTSGEDFRCGRNRAEIIYLSRDVIGTSKGAGFPDFKEICFAGGIEVYDLLGSS